MKKNLVPVSFAPLILAILIGLPAAMAQLELGERAPAFPGDIPGVGTPGDDGDDDDEGGDDGNGQGTQGLGFVTGGGNCNAFPDSSDGPNIGFSVIFSDAVEISLSGTIQVGLAFPLVGDPDEESDACIEQVLNVVQMAGCLTAEVEASSHPGVVSRHFSFICSGERNSVITSMIEISNALFLLEL